ncbi:PREDICTED: uncharacterized protein LOC106896683 isoform X1 [Calidris pugnax]|uniref:uncharacterized protein LOC106896683 isoform X1 n=1 Tax=Calidris pugnax TaxID=198806 RepID=UPI00071DCC8E|nr:PREDICTED: uncharacterized protein LOC106896683 isoform X1 [Calidris pugnax]
MDLRMYWISKTAIPEIIIMIFYITAGWTENCTTHQDLDDVPDPEDWTRNGYLGNAGLNITYKKTKVYTVLKIDGQIRRDWGNSRQIPSFEIRENSLVDIACKFDMAQVYLTTVMMVGIYVYNLEEPQQCIFSAVCTLHQEYCQVEVQPKVSSMIRCIGVIHDARKMIRSYRQVALILVPKDITTTHGMDKAQTIKSITLSPQLIPFPKVKRSNTILNYNAPIIYKKYVIYGENIACKKEIKTFTQPFTFRSMVTCNASEKAENITINIKYNSTEKGKFIIWEVPTGTRKATCQQPQCSFTIVNKGEAVYKIGALFSLESRSATFLFPFALHVPRRNIITPSPTTIPLFEPANCAVKYHNLSFAGPYVVRQSNEQKLFLDPTYSLKKVRVKVQADISQIKSECLPFVSQSLKGWKAWLHSRAHHSRKQRDLTGWFGSGLGVLNSIDQEVIINKLSTVTSDLGRLEVPLRSSLITLAGAKKMLSHPDIKMLLKKVKEVSKRTLWQVQHNTLEIKKIITAIKKTGEHHWWDIFLNTSLKSPTAAQFFNFLLHPVLVLIFVVLLLTLLNIWLWWKVRTVAQQVHVLWAVNKIMQKNLQ